MSSYTPDVWKVIEVTNEGHPARVSVLGGWYGGWAGSNSWKLSSGIMAWDDQGDYYEAKNASGSVYRCYKASERTSMLTMSVLQGWIKEAEDSNGKLSIRVLDVEGGDVVQPMSETAE
jgi:hypothetical protein